MSPNDLPLNEEHVMIDLETLGTRPGSMIVSIGACVFDLNKGIGETFYAIIDIARSNQEGPIPLCIEGSTVKWWMQQSDEARAVFNDPAAEHIASSLQRFRNWLDEVGGKYIWGHGASFDPVLLDAAFFACDLKTPWSHKAIRDTRTIFELAQVSAEDFAAGIKHNALDDAIAQAHAVIEAHKRLGRPLG